MKTNVQLTNLKLSGKDSYVYRTAETGEVIEVEVKYSTGMSLSHRGIWVSVSPITYEQHDGYRSKSFALCSGVSIMVERLDRFKPSALFAKAERLDGQVIQLAQLFAITTKEEVKASIREVFGLPAPTTNAPARYQAVRS